MDPQLQVIHEALHAVHGDTTPTRQRAQAQQHLDSVKHNFISTVVFVPTLIDLANEPRIRHFGLLLFEHTVKYGWNQMSPQQKGELKQLAQQLVLQGCRDITVEEKYIKEKIVAVVTEIAKREWPPLFPELMDTLVQAANSGQAVALEVSLLCIRSLGEAAQPPRPQQPQHRDLPMRRRREMKEGLKEGLAGGLSSFIAQCLTNYYGEYTNLAAAYTSGKQEVAGSLQTTMTILTAVLQACEQMMGFIPVEPVMEHKFIPMFCALLTDRHYREPAVAALIATYKNRSITIKQRPHLLIILNEMQAVMAGLSVGTNPFEEHAFRREITSLLATVGYLQLDCRKTVVHPAFGNYIAFLLEYTKQNTSWANAMALLPFWMYYVREMVTDESVEGTGVVFDALLGIAGDQILALSDDSELEGDLRALAELDFNDDQIKTIRTELRSRYRILVRSLTNVNPARSFAFVAQYFAAALSCVSQGGHPRPELVMTAAVMILTTSVSSLRSTAWSKVDAAFVKLLEDMLSGLLGFGVDNFAVMTQVAEGLRGFAPFLAHFPNFLPPTLDRLLSLAQLPAVAANSADATKLRRTACQAMMRLMIMSRNGSLDTVLPDFAGKVQQLMQQNAFALEERMLLMEALAAGGSQLSDHNIRFNFLQSVYQPLVEKWNSQSLQAVLTNPEVLGQWLGLFGDGGLPDAQGGEFISPAIKPSTIFTNASLGVRDTLLYLVKTMSAIIRHVTRGERVKKNVDETTPDDSAKHILAPLLDGFLPNTLSLVRSLHMLWSNEAKAGVPPTHQPALGPCVDDELKKARTRSEDVIPPEEEIALLRGWLYQLRRACYEAIGAASTLGEICWANGRGDMLAASMFDTAALAAMNNGHLAVYVLMFLRPFLRTLPPSLQPLILDPLVGPVFAGIFDRLDQGWKNKAQRHLKVASNVSLDDEIAYDSELAELSINHIKLLLAVVPSRYSSEKIATLGARILGSESTGVPFVSCAFTAMTWQDSTVCYHGILLTSRLLPLIENNPAYTQYAAQMAPGLAIQALMDIPHESLQNQLLSLIARMYRMLTPLAPNVVRGVFLSCKSITQESLQEFEAALNSNDSIGDRELVRNLLGGVIGVNTVNSSHYKLDSTILNLNDNKESKGIADLSIDTNLL